jgi:endonuclease/exonuclease/phosphatase family metal-dependent hydrolase
MKTRFLSTCLALSALLVTSSSVFADHQGAGGGREIIIMSRNLYVGFDEAAAVVGVVSGIPALPVIFVGDLNSRADGTGTPTYANVLAAGFTDVFTATNPAAMGDTCCHAAVLTDSDPTLDQGIDYVLIRGDLQPLVAEILGEEPADFAAYGIWPSDHAGVAASVDLHSRP